jgi:diguanylate cyclase (GGDEF)-like protein
VLPWRPLRQWCTPTPVRDAALTRPLAWAAFTLLTSAAVTAGADVSYGVRAATVVSTAVLLLRAARRRDAMAASLVLIATGLLVAATSGVGATIQELITGRSASIGSWTDWLELFYVPFVVAGVLFIPTPPGGRVRIIADATVAAAALWYVTLTLVVEHEDVATHLDAVGRWATAGFAILPTFVIAVLLSVLPRAVPEARRFLLWAAAGMAVVVAADLCFAIATWRDSYDPASWMAALHQAGLAILLAAAVTAKRMRPVPTPSLPLASTSGVSAMLPFLPLGGAVALVFIRYLGQQDISHAETLPLVLLGTSVFVRHAASVRDHGLLVASLERRERAALEEALRDPLTGLDNRVSFVDTLGVHLADPAAHPVAVALLDLNDFKDVNDNHGHDTGDQLLQACAERLLTIAPDGACVARLGGDEFALCQPRANDGGRGLADRIVRAFEAPIEVGRRRFAVRPSVGVVVDERAEGGSGSADAAHLLAHADVAMYQAKATKESPTAPAAVVLGGVEREQAADFIRLREEIGRPQLDQFRVVYQPVVHLRTGVVEGVEALLRWDHPELGEIGPTQFIPLAEQVGSIGVLGRHVLITASGDMARWVAIAPERPLTVGVNLSPRELTDDDLPARVAGVLGARALDPARLVFEITEGALMDELEVAVTLVRELRALGVSVAVDDFGTGYSSLRYLRRFSADVIKIDKEFVQAMPSERRTVALVHSIVDMADALNLRLVAEGIETMAQLEAVRAVGCSLGQGFLFGEVLDGYGMDRLVRSGDTYPVGEDTGGTPRVDRPRRATARRV